MDIRDSVKGRTVIVASPVALPWSRSTWGPEDEILKAAFSLQMCNAMNRGPLVMGSPFYLGLREGTLWVAYKKSSCIQ